MSAAATGPVAVTAAKTMIALAEPTVSVADAVVAFAEAAAVRVGRATTTSEMSAAAVPILTASAVIMTIRANLASEVSAAASSAIREPVSIPIPCTIRRLPTFAAREGRSSLAARTRARDAWRRRSASGACAIVGPRPATR